jgi:hypothetical protein
VGGTSPSAPWITPTLHTSNSRTTNTSAITGKRVFMDRNDRELAIAAESYRQHPESDLGGFRWRVLGLSIVSMTTVSRVGARVGRLGGMPFHKAVRASLQLLSDERYQRIGVTL